MRERQVVKDDAQFHLSNLKRRFLLAETKKEKLCLCLIYLLDIQLRNLVRGQSVNLWFIQGPGRVCTPEDGHDVPIHLKNQN